MKLSALVAVLGLLGACTVQPDLGEQPAKAVQVMPGKFQSQHGLYFKVVDDGSTYMQQLLEHVPIDKPEGIVADIDGWQTEEGRTATDYYLSAPSPELIEHYVGLTVPHDRELAFEQLDANRWRSYLLMPAAELDASAIAHAEASRDPNTDRPIVMVDFTSTGAAHLAELTKRIAGHKLAVLVDGTVISAPVINQAITGGRASISLGVHGTDAQARTLAASL